MAFCAVDLERKTFLAYWQIFPEYCPYVCAIQCTNSAGLLVSHSTEFFERLPFYASLCSAGACSCLPISISAMQLRFEHDSAKIDPFARLFRNRIPHRLILDPQHLVWTSIRTTRRVPNQEVRYFADPTEWSDALPSHV